MQMQFGPLKHYIISGIPALKPVATWSVYCWFVATELTEAGMLLLLFIVIIGAVCAVTAAAFAGATIGFC